MRLTLAAIAKLPRGPEKTLCDDLAARAGALARTTSLGPVDIREIEIKNAGATRDAIRSAEAKALRAALEGCEKIVALDERGRTLKSVAFSETLTKWRDQGVRNAGFLIGGAEGLDPELRESADLAVSFGALTWPHALARVMLVEQLYRAATIAAGHPYHREG